MSRIPNRQINATFINERSADRAPSSSSRASNSRQRAPSNATPQPAAPTGTDPLSPTRLTTLKTILDRLLRECHTPYTRDAYDTDLHTLCLQTCAQKGYPIGHNSPHLVNPDRYLACGVIIASGAYRHLPRHLQAFIAIYTAFATWMDDVYSDDLAGVDLFYPRFLSGERQATPGLDAMARIIREIPALYGETSAQGSIIAMATLRFVSGTLLEYEGKHVKMTSSSRRFSTYLRSFTGISEAYAMFIFPPGMSIRTYMQAIPDLCHYINHYNDMLSFYKEEKAGEINNYISLEAAVLGEDKLTTLARLGREVAASSQRATEILETPEAVNAFASFKRGYLTFHTSLESRYLLRDLFGGRTGGSKS